MDEKFFPDLTPEIFHAVVSVLAVMITALSVWAIIHAIIYKRDSRSALGWVALIILSPVIGLMLYFVFGINRIRRKAARLKGGDSIFSFIKPNIIPVRNNTGKQGEVKGLSHNIKKIMLAGDIITGKRVYKGNEVKMLKNAEEARREMIREIDGARRSVGLVSYFFVSDREGMEMVEALSRAKKRGAKVMVLLDDLGIKHSLSGITRVLKKHKIQAARFLKITSPFQLTNYNLRNHRKILLIDGKRGFTGSMNIGGHYDKNGREKVRDCHFMFSGPIVRDLAKVFAEDWEFTAGEKLRGRKWFPKLKKQGEVPARGISDGPDKDFEKAYWDILAAITNAEKRIYVQTPYFIPDATIISSLGLAAMRGVDVRILIPQKGNSRIADWASRTLWWRLVERGCGIYLIPPPFDHSKIMMVDDTWSFIGSANWDSRSLRLNFEYNIELYDRKISTEIRRVFNEKIRKSRKVTAEKLRRISFPEMVRNGIARLFSPYL